MAASAICFGGGIMAGKPTEILLSEFADDPDMAELVELFVSELPERLAVLRTGLESNALEQVQRIAHQLKGASGGYGFPLIGDCAARVEAAVKTGAALDQIRRCVDELSELCNRAAST
ncbi:MAG: Hpt domain-containing protein [Phycisphaerales bacterium]|nr:Hpt domain-containing protein [Phycisphaerales bacterium]